MPARLGKVLDESPAVWIADACQRASDLIFLEYSNEPLRASNRRRWRS